MTKRYKHILTLMLVAYVAFSWSIGRVQAHAALVRSEPGDNAVLETSPGEIRLWFNEAISPEFSTARLLDLNGKEVKLDGLRTDPADPYVLLLDPPELEPGAYSINWNVLSDADGHTTQGLIVFGIGEGVDLGAGSGASRDVIPWLEVLLRWTNYGLLAAIFGSLAVVLFLVDPARRKQAAPVALYLDQGRRRIMRWAQIAVWIAIAVGIGWFLYQFWVLYQSVPAGASPLRVAWQLLARTRWGDLWLLRQGILLAMGLLLTRPNMRWVLPLSGILSLSLIVIQSASGHAAAIANNTGLVVAVAAFHLLGVAFWVGGLSALVIGIVPLLKEAAENRRQLIRAVWEPFGVFAGISVGVVIATGIFSLGQQSISADAVLRSLYGKALLLKVGLMLFVGLFGLVNALVLHPRLARPLGKLLGQPSGWTPLEIHTVPRLVIFEISLGIVVFLLASVVTSLPPARGPEYYAVSGDFYDSLSTQVDDLLINFSAKPNVPGPNVYTIRVNSQRRPAPYEVLRVILRFTYLGQEMGTITADTELLEEGVYRLGGNYFSIAGPWQVEIAVRRSGVENSVARFDWLVPPTSEPRPVLISTAVWRDGLALVSAGFLVALALIVLLIWGAQIRRAPRIRTKIE